MTTGQQIAAEVGRDILLRLAAWQGPIDLDALAARIDAAIAEAVKADRERAPLYTGG